MPTDPIDKDRGNKKVAILINRDAATGRYYAEGGKVRRVRQKRRNNAQWTFRNRTGSDIFVRLHSFSPACPFSEQTFPKGVCVTKVPQRGTAVQVGARVKRDAQLGKHTYVMDVWPATGNKDDATIIDPELQIDDDHGPLHKILIAIAVVAAGLGLGLWYYFS